MRWGDTPAQQCTCCALSYAHAGAVHTGTSMAELVEQVGAGGVGATHSAYRSCTASQHGEVSIGAQSHELCLALLLESATDMSTPPSRTKFRSNNGTASCFSLTNS